MSFLHWEKLLESRCPKCGSELFDRGLIMNCVQTDDGNPFRCDFQISTDRFDELVEKMKNKQKIDEEMEE